MAAMNEKKPVITWGTHEVKLIVKKNPFWILQMKQTMITKRTLKNMFVFTLFSATNVRKFVKLNTT